MLPLQQANAVDKSKLQNGKWVQDKAQYAFFAA